jgi:hypothetical protein
MNLKFTDSSEQFLVDSLLSKNEAKYSHFEKWISLGARARAKECVTPLRRKGRGNILVFYGMLYLDPVPKPMDWKRERVKKPTYSREKRKNNKKM